MKLAAVCCTYLRPQLLGQLIECFLRQDYPRELRELIILDDAGQYENQAGDGWKLISIPNRFRSLGEKRNACIALASPDVEGYLVADDDDVYLPHWFRTQAEALKRAEWSRPSLYLHEHGNGLKEAETCGQYHASWAFRREAFYKIRGYGPYNNGEDTELASRLSASGITECDPCQFAPPFFIWGCNTDSYHLSYMDDQGFMDLANHAVGRQSGVHPTWFRDWNTLPVIRFAQPRPVEARDGKMSVQLIGRVDQPGSDGPTNGMYALQRALTKRIDQGLDWLSIKSMPPDNGALPWFWNWEDRRYASWWDSQGRPFVQGPNMLFINSANPRIDFLESALLDSANCRAMFCHSEWYRELIMKHRGPKNQSPIVLWPYPISPWPDEPLPDQYDLLIYSKTDGYRKLVERLVEVFPRHIRIDYGSYRREQLYDAARRSRACVYTADDEHGGLALQEILLSGCPAVGIRTGAPLVRHQVTGQIVDRLPFPNNSDNHEDDERTFSQFLNAITESQALDRHAVRQRAIEDFNPDRILDCIVEVLEQCRQTECEPERYGQSHRF